jgi:CubicO group peptidase (beta-lactamase class C family)
VDDDVADKWNAGLVPFYISTGTAITSGGAIELTETRFNVLYVPRPPPAGRELLDTALISGLSDWQLNLTNDEMRADGAHLVSLASYRDPNDIGSKLYAGIWHRYTEWVETVEGDMTTEGEDFQALEDAALAAMEAENIPAAQLAVFQGDDLVLSRAYTLAPIAYAPITTATPLMASSLTKPITAAVAIKGFTVSGLGDDLMDLVPNPTIQGGTKPTGCNSTPITVRHALQHTSGWEIDVSAFDVKSDLMTDRLPTSQDWLDWMSVQETPDHGLNCSGFGFFSYSNFPYEMVALALKVEAAIDPHDPLNEYESDLLWPVVFDEVGMCRTAYKRQGLLDTDVAWMSKPFAEPAYGSCTVGDICGEEPRFYLTEPSHPYAGATAPLTELDNPAMFEPSTLDDAAPVPAYLRRQTYGGDNAVHAYIGSGSVVSTAEDLARFMASFRPFLADGLGTPLLTVAQATAMFPEGGANAGTQCYGTEGRVNAQNPGLRKCYGLGWYVGNEEFEDPEIWWHGGDVEGSVSVLMYHPEMDATVAVLFARHAFTAPDLADAIKEALDALAQ